MSENEDKKIYISEDAKETIIDAQKKLNEMNLQLTNYVIGLRHGLNVDNDWVLNSDEWAFMPSLQSITEGDMNVKDQ